GQARPAPDPHQQREDRSAHRGRILLRQRQSAATEDRPDPAERFEQIGRLKMELEWLKKNFLTADIARALIDETHPSLSVRRQCELLGLSRSSLYYEATPESQENLRLMAL